MKATTIKQTLFVLLSVSLFFSCKKDDKPTPPKGCSIDMASIAGTYKLTALTYAAAGDKDPVDYLPFLDDCDKDNITIFGKDGVYEYKDLGAVCDPSSSEKGVWNLQDKTIVIDGEATGAIESFDCSKLVYSAGGILLPGDKMTMTYTKQ
ncbi:lipocalin-like domain-containing protein [Chitinophaga pinensis]|uniref:Lipocalin-like domain-containing protein n=1 Tax=Chitinophaga pinensis (strain ATCC 43595 / DSM 2588 / LMG 13176 / NBRC 15968 / NCIMB 11800 / UQM 2034) TaxID=485918 RepID=A0A979GZS7_CHIPD|nr:lipocalin family protein [Chitinophaga pinensis]ACU62795.1 hypothetical protein Cpin_5364 [Chitinophaga pinensis DSM 2588]